MHIPKSCIGNDFERKEQNRWQECGNLKREKITEAWHTTLKYDVENIISRKEGFSRKYVKYDKCPSPNQTKLL